MNIPGKAKLTAKEIYEQVFNENGYPIDCDYLTAARKVADKATEKAYAQGVADTQREIGKRLWSNDSDPISPETDYYTCLKGYEIQALKSGKGVIKHPYLDFRSLFQ